MKTDSLITIDENRFEEIFTLVFNAYANKTGIFAKHQAETLGPQFLYRPTRVEVGSKQHLYWLALVAFSDRRTNSSTLYRNFAKLFSRNRRLFEVGFYPTIRRTTRLFRKYKIALPVGEISWFIERKRHLDEFFDGDPIKIYENVSDVEELMMKLKRIARERDVRIPFPGAKMKIFSLLAMFLSELTTLQFKDVVPIDVWVQSICTSTGVIGGNGKIQVNKLEHKLRPLMTKLFSRFRHIKGAMNATWIHGKSLCTHCDRLNLHTACPVFHLCNGPFSRMRNPATGKHNGYIQVPPDFVPKGTKPH